MEKVSVDEVERLGHPVSTAPGGRPIGEALGVEGFAMRHYELDPGQTFSGGLHTHEDQEEVFYVVEGTATFRTRDGAVEVRAGEAVRFAPGEYQHGRNESDGRVVGLALGAPRGTEELRALAPCPECGEEAELGVEIPESRDVVVLTCPECGVESRVEG